MNEMWKKWEGRTVDGRFLLENYLGGSNRGSVFLTHRQSRAGSSEKVAIKLIPADPATSEKQFLRWKTARELGHPNLITILDVGRCKLDRTELLYAVEEYAEENLAQVLPERALTAEEARGMLPPILRALQFVHDKGFVHGRIQPSNILAVGDQVKLSSDALSTPGESGGGASAVNIYDAPEVVSGAGSRAGDVWQLGMTLIEVLTQRPPSGDRSRSSASEIPPSVPEPFREIVGRSLQVDPEKRWAIADILERLGEPRPQPVAVGKESVASGMALSRPRKVSAAWSYLLGLAALLAVAFLFMPKPKSAVKGPAIQPQNGPSAENSQTSSGPAADAMTASVPLRSQNPGTPNPHPENDVVQRVLPEVSPAARRTIHGDIQVRVKVKVGAAGDVEVAKVESGRASRYFKRLALEAARDWKFSPAQNGEAPGREWKLQFDFTRTKTEATATRAKH
jgi:TonB family protein